MTKINNLLITDSKISFLGLELNDRTYTICTRFTVLRNHTTPKINVPHITFIIFGRSPISKFIKILEHLVKLTRQRAGLSEEPTQALIDSQSVKTTGAVEQKGFDAGKKRKE